MRTRYAIASIVLATIALAWWGVSYYSTPPLRWVNRHRGWAVRAHGGSFQWWVVRVQRFVDIDEQGRPVVEQIDLSRAHVPMPSLQVAAPMWPPVAVSRVSVINETATPSGQVAESGIRATIVSVPHWVIAGLLASPSLVWVLGLRRRRASTRAEAGLCVTCGYDLRASGGRCPECGSAAVPALSNARLLEVARTYRPPQAWFDDETDPTKPSER